jgi:hypothetical protein
MITIRRPFLLKLSRLPTYINFLKAFEKLHLREKKSCHWSFGTRNSNELGTHQKRTDLVTSMSTVTLGVALCC